MASVNKKQWLNETLFLPCIYKSQRHGHRKQRISRDEALVMQTHVILFVFPEYTVEDTLELSVIGDATLPIVLQ